MPRDPVPVGAEVVPHRKTVRWLWKNLAVVGLCLTVLGGTYLVVKVQQNTSATRELAQQNQERIADVARESRQRDAQIQRSRIFACQYVYDGIKALIQPYNPDPPTAASRLFNHRLNVLKRKCPTQVLRPRKAVTP